MKTSSKFVQLNKYALLEYQYNKDIISTSNVAFAKIDNMYYNSICYTNYNAKDNNIPKLKTSNIIDNSIVQITDSTWLLLDRDKLFHFARNYPHFTVTSSEGEISSNINVVYDNIKIHLLSGWNFPNLAGFITKVGYRDINGNFIYSANIAFLKDSDYIQYSYHPLLLGERLYDRYIEFKIPSLNFLQTDGLNSIADYFATYGDGSDQAKKQYLVNGTNSFLWENSSISFLYIEAQDLLTDSFGSYYITAPTQLSQEDQTSILVNLDPIDEFSSIGAIVQESNYGDYFELFPTYNDTYLDSFIEQQKLKGINYIVINEIEIFEQSFIDGNYNENSTYRTTHVQTEDFFEPFVFRPIIKGKNTLTFTIDYTVRLVNDVTNTQIVRKASLTYFDAKKYGGKLVKLNTDLTLESIKIVNKILYDTQVNNFYAENISLPFATNNLNNSSANIFIDQNNIILNVNSKIISSSENSIINGKSIKTYNFQDVWKADSYFGQNELTIYLNEYDNFLLFSFFKYDSNNGITSLLLDKNNAKYFINFVLNDDSFVKIYNIEDNSYNIHLDSNQLFFKIDAMNSNKIIKMLGGDFTINEEFINTNNYTSFIEHTNMIYKGKYDKINNFSDKNYNSKYEVLKNYYDEILNTKNNLNVLLDDNKSLIETLKSYAKTELEKQKINDLLEAINKIQI